MDSLLNGALVTERVGRLRAVMRERGVDAIFTSDPINIVYACGVRNMTIFGMMGPSRFLLLFADGYAILWEFAGCAHLSDGLSTVNEVRDAPGITANSGPGYAEAIHSFAGEIADACRSRGVGSPLAVERLDFEMTDALRASGLPLSDATGVFLEARRVKQPSELAVIREAITRVEAGNRVLESSITPGLSEVEIWSRLHQHLVATDGEYISTRLLQAGPNTFPYFQEASSRPVQEGELLCLDTDAVGYGGYGVDLSRTFFVGPGEPSVMQRELYQRAYDQLQHNAGLLRGGLPFEELARGAWPIPKENRAHGYYCLLHGLGMTGEHPYVPLHTQDNPYDFPGHLEADMIVCVESYIGSEAAGQGVKLEDQFLITANGAERLTSYPFADELLSSPPR